jgi:hypothetical protein
MAMGLLNVGTSRGGGGPLGVVVREGGSVLCRVIDPCVGGGCHEGRLVLSGVAVP